MKIKLKDLDKAIKGLKKESVLENTFPEKYCKECKKIYVVPTGQTKCPKCKGNLSK